MNPIRVLYQLYPALLAQIPSGQVFDSHWFIQRLTQANQATYVQSLSRYPGQRDPFRKVHAQLSRLLHHQKQYVRFVGRHFSPDIFGDVVDCGAWVKL